MTFAKVIRKEVVWRRPIHKMLPPGDEIVNIPPDTPRDTTRRPRHIKFRPRSMR